MDSTRIRDEKPTLGSSAKSERDRLLGGKSKPHPNLGRPITTEGIPNELAAARCWLAFRFEQAGGKWTKIPYRWDASQKRFARGMSNQKADHVACLMDLHALIAVLAKMDPKGTDYGLMFAPRLDDDGQRRWVALDLDNAHPDDQMEWPAFMREAASEASGWFCQSPSGKGVRVIGFLRQDHGCREVNSKVGGCEIKFNTACTITTAPVIGATCQGVDITPLVQSQDLQRPKKAKTAPKVENTAPILPAGDPSKFEDYVIDRCRKYLATVEHHKGGEHGHDCLFRAACKIAGEYGLRGPEGRQLFEEWNQNSDHPDGPESDYQVGHKWENALATTANDRQIKRLECLRDWDYYHGRSYGRPGGANSPAGEFKAADAVAQGEKPDEPQPEQEDPETTTEKLLPLFGPNGKPLPTFLLPEDEWAQIWATANQLINVEPNTFFAPGGALKFLVSGPDSDWTTIPAATKDVLAKLTMTLRPFTWKQVKTKEGMILVQKAERFTERLAGMIASPAVYQNLPFPSVWSITPAPILLGNRFAREAGVIKAQGVALTRNHPDLPEGEIPADPGAAKRLVESISRLLEPFPLADRNAGAAWCIGALATMIFTQELRGAISPAFLAAGVAETAEATSMAGKTFLCDLLASIVLGKKTCLPRARISETPRETANSIASALSNEPVAFVLDNLDSESRLACASLDEYITSAKPSIRAMFSQKPIAVSDPKPVMFMTGNRIKLGPETESRCLVLAVTGKLANTDIDIMDLALRMRAEILTDLAASWQAFRGLPRGKWPELESDRFHDFRPVLAFVKWASGADLTEASQAAKKRARGAELTGLATGWIEAIGLRKRVRTGVAVQAAQLAAAQGRTKLLEVFRGIVINDLNGRGRQEKPGDDLGRSATYPIGKVLNEAVGLPIHLPEVIAEDGEIIPGRVVRFAKAKDRIGNGHLYYLETLEPVEDQPGSTCTQHPLGLQTAPMARGHENALETSPPSPPAPIAPMFSKRLLGESRGVDGGENSGGIGDGDGRGGEGFGENDGCWVQKRPIPFSENDLRQHPCPHPSKTEGLPGGQWDADSQPADSSSSLNLPSLAPAPNISSDYAHHHASGAIPVFPTDPEYQGGGA